jgi:putative FmdB family regulatory protein
MPTYEYACSSCGNEWEEVQKISEPALQECPKCHLSTARRQISGGRFILKGGGWYADLYSSVKPGKKDESKGSSAATSESKGTSSEGGSSSTSSTKEGAPAAAPAAPAAPSTPAK